MSVEQTVQIEIDEDDFDDEEAEQFYKMQDAINAFLDEVNRPVGSMTFDVPKSDAVNRAIVGLYDAIGRNL
jgi:hypothetical protein